MKVRGSFSLIVLLFAATSVAPAAAHGAMSPTYVSSQPSDGAKLDEAPEQVEVTFDEPLDQSSELRVDDECGRRIDGGDVTVQANMMSVGIAQSPSGTYRVTYFARSLGGVTGQETGIFSFLVRGGPSCGPKAGGGHEGHGDGKGDGGKGSGGKHDGGHQDGSSDGHPGSGGGHQSGGPEHSKMDHASKGDHSSMNHKKGSGKHGSGKHRSGKHGSGPGAKGAHGLLDILDQNEREAEGALAADEGAFPAPDGRAIALALALSVLMGVLGGWFLRVSAAR